MQREVDLEIADLHQGLGGGGRGAHASSAAASASRSSGASRPAGMSSLACSQHSERRAGPGTTVGGHSSAQTFIASGQRGGDRPGGGGGARVGGAPRGGGGLGGGRGSGA